MVLSWCGARAKKPSTGETLSSQLQNVIYPVRLLDQPTQTQKMLTWVMCFNDVLDASMLHTSLCRLLEIGDWKKLGSRLRVRDDGLLEAFAPKKFTLEYPACTFFHDEHYNSHIRSHPAGRHFSLPTERAFTQTYPSDSRSELAHPNAPLTVQHLIDRNLPLLVLHIMGFCDATVVTLSWPGSIMDNDSFKWLIHAWSLVLDGRQDTIPKAVGCRGEDVLQGLVSKPHEQKTAQESITEDRSAPSRYWIPEWLRRRSQAPTQKRMVYIPKVIYSELLKEVKRDVSRLLEDEKHRPLLNDADILFAWVTKLQGEGGEGKSRAVIASNMVNLRHHIYELGQSRYPYIQNLTFAVHSILSAEDTKESVSQIALKHKRSMDKMSSENQLLSLIKSLLETRKIGKDPLQPKADAGTVSLKYCNMASMELLKVADFGPAVLHCGDLNTPRYNPPGTMTAGYSLEMDTKVTEPVCQVIGKDHGDHFWMYCQLEPDVWVKLEEELYRLQKCFNSPVVGKTLRFPSTYKR
ncbi:hypothetical protein QQS21_001655 [Conoideocrella luteorostrata]|uniref:Uncharacterized protein n=1 Tax=Conoideocrella luteorostrata TaxID=1105319 RepID=A0AAJ0G3C7_9HYPO|nr:hypothetical protein QQS21_001655 [Conoideocrella luteorostrata]